jgi:hypothetical protein
MCDWARRGFPLPPQNHRLEQVSAPSLFSRAGSDRRAGSCRRPASSDGALDRRGLGRRAVGLHKLEGEGHPTSCSGTGRLSCAYRELSSVAGAQYGPKRPENGVWRNAARIRDTSRISRSQATSRHLPGSPARAPRSLGD